MKLHREYELINKEQKKYAATGGAIKLSSFQNS
jgi:hypothetical protein